MLRFRGRGFNRQLLLFTLILLVLPGFLTYYMLHVIQRAEQSMIERDREKLQRALQQLDRRLEYSFDEILEAHNVPPDARNRDKVKVLNTALKPVIDSVQKDFPGVELGFYSIKHDVILNGHTETYGENFSLRRKEDIMRTVREKQPVTNIVGFGGRSSGLIEAYRPLFRDGELIGAVVAQENAEDIYKQITRVRQEAYLTIVAGIIIGVGGFFFLLNRFLDVISGVKKGLANLEIDLSYRLPPAFGELGEIAAAINHLAGRLEQMRSFNEIVLDNVDAGVIATDEKGRLAMVNPTAAKVLDLVPSQVLGRPLAEVFPGDNPVRRVLEQALIRRETVRDFTVNYAVRSGSLSEETAGIQKPGSPLAEGNRDLIIGTNLLTDQRRNFVGVVLTFKDVTEHNRLEERIKRQERLAALGKFVAGVAHEIRNPLTSISGYIQMWQRRGQPTAEALSTVAREMVRLNNIVDKLLFFARPAESKFQAYNINDLVGQVLKFVEEGDGSSKIQVKTRFEPALPPGRIDAEQMQQVLMNIVYNAFQAMPDGGILKVKTGLTADHRYVTVSLTDSGPGIPPENLPRIFDPFFTTKARGSGLGLALAHEIVSAHGGYIEAKSTLGVGTMLKVYIPVYKEGENGATDTCG